jgi:hypothetical protein
MRFEIDRAKWLHGQPEAPNSRLLDDQGRMCCLGFCALALGLSRNQIDGLGEPGEVDLLDVSGDPVSPWPETFVYVSADEDGRVSRDTIFSGELISLNDESESGDRELGQTIAEFRADKERRLIAKFAEIGYEAVFVGEYPDHGAPAAPPLDDSAVRDALIEDSESLSSAHRDSREAT